MVHLLLRGGMFETGHFLSSTFFSMLDLVLFGGEFCEVIKSAGGSRLVALVSPSTGGDQTKRRRGRISILHILRLSFTKLLLNCFLRDIIFSGNVYKHCQRHNGPMLLSLYYVKLELPFWLQIWPSGLVLVPILATRWRHFH